MKHKGDIIASGNLRVKQNADVDGNLNVDGSLAVSTFSATTITANTADVNNLVGPTRATNEFTHVGPTSFYNILTTSSGVQNREVRLANTAADVTWDWRYANSFFLQLRRKTVTIHTPTLPGNASQVNLVVQQPSNGFYHIKWSDRFKWADGTQLDATQSRSAVDIFSFHYSPIYGKIIAVGTQNLFYST